jgi:Phage major capsid protein E
MQDIWHDPAFGVVSLTDAINKPIFQPGRIGQMGIFTETGVTTVDIAIEEKGGILALIPPTPRGGPGTTLPKTGRTLRVLRAPHFEINDGIMAEEVQGVRAWGSDGGQVEVLMDKVAERLVIHRSSMEATMEYARAGAIKGIIVYPDGSQTNLFNEFEVTPEPPIDFDLDNPTPVGGVLREQCAKLIRTMSRNLGGIPYTGVTALVGDDFFDALLKHPEVRATFLQTPDAAQLRLPYVNFQGQIYGTFPFGGIVWENYRGYVGGTEFIETDKAYFFPTGTPNLFKTYLAPADYNETVNTQGQRMYAKQYDMPNDKGVHLDVQMNPLNICTRPKALMQGLK